MATRAYLRLLFVSTASLIFFSVPALGGETANAAIQPVPNIIPGATIDLGKVEKIRDLLENQVQKPVTDIVLENAARWNEIFVSHINWNDIVHGGGGPLSALCSDRCKRCASGCNPICCQVGGLSSLVCDPMVLQMEGSLAPCKAFFPSRLPLPL